MYFQPDDKFSDISSLSEDRCSQLSGITCGSFNPDNQIPRCQLPVEQDSENLSCQNIGTLLKETIEVIHPNDLHQQGSFYGVQSGDVSEFFPSINTTTPHLTSTAIILPNSPVDHLTFVANPQPEAQPITYSPFNNIVDHEEIVEPMADLPVTPKILTKHQIIGQLNNLVHKELNVYHKLFCQRYAVGGWYKKCDLLRFMNLESLEFPSDFSTEHMMGILTNPGMYSPAIVAKACLELYIGRHMLILIKEFLSIHPSLLCQQTNFYTVIWCDFTGVLQELKWDGHAEYAKELWCEICTKYITGYKEMISEQNQFLRPAFYDNLTLLDFIDWHKAYITEEQWYFHAGNYHIRFFQLFKKDARMPFRGGGAPIQKRELHQVSPQALKRADGVASMRKNDLIALQPTKQPRLAPNHVAQQFQTSLLILDDETIPKTPVNMQFSWDYLVPGAKEYYSINNPPEIFMTLSYTQRSDSSLMVWALTPNKDEIFLQFYNTSKTNNATKDVYSKYYECRLCGRKAGFKLTVDIHMHQTTLEIPKRTGKSNVLKKLEHNCIWLVTRNDPELLIENLKSLAVGKVKSLCSDGKILDIKSAKMKLLEVCEKICKNIYGGEYFPNWVAEEFDAKIKKKLVREQSFGREIREVKIGAYWALLFYNAISIFVTDNEKRAKVAYDTSKFLEYRYAISTPAHLRIDALKSIQKLGFPDTLDWDVINSIIKQFETIKLSKNFAVSEWFLKHLIREAETKKSLRRAIESIARDDGVPEEYEL